VTEDDLPPGRYYQPFMRWVKRRGQRILQERRYNRTTEKTFWVDVPTEVEEAPTEQKG
jgi:hypothetical protein